MIYVAVGFDIFQKRNQLRQFSNPRPSLPRGSNDESPIVNKTTKVEITSEPAHSHSGSRDPWELSNISVGTGDSPAPSFVEYSITIESGPSSRKGPHMDRPMGHNSASWGYARIAFIFFIALLVTWVCSPLQSIPI
jgi:hypothetical protein